MFKTTSELVAEVNRSPTDFSVEFSLKVLRMRKSYLAPLMWAVLFLMDGPGFRADHFPFGGVKLSGVGREGARYALEEMSVTKTLCGKNESQSTCP